MSAFFDSFLHNNTQQETVEENHRKYRFFLCFGFKKVTCTSVYLAKVKMSACKSEVENAFNREWKSTYYFRSDIHGYTGWCPRWNLQRKNSPRDQIQKWATWWASIFSYLQYEAFLLSELYGMCGIWKPHKYCLSFWRYIGMFSTESRRWCVQCQVELFGLGAKCLIYFGNEVFQVGNDSIPLQPRSNQMRPRQVSNLENFHCCDQMGSSLVSLLLDGQTFLFCFP